MTVVIVLVCAGCAEWSSVYQSQGSHDSYAGLLKLYQEGRIDAQQLTSRQSGIAIRQEYFAAHPSPPSTDSSTDSTSTTDTTDDRKCKDDHKHPDPRCPNPPGGR